MSFHFFTIQFLKDTFIREPRNIAVVGHDGKRAYFRALGLASAQFDPLPFKALASDSSANTWVYREWLEWFSYLIHHEGKDLNGLKLELSKLTKNKELILGSHGQIETLDGQTSDQIFDELFKTLVKAPSIPRSMEFHHLLSEILDASEISSQSGFMENAIIELEEIESHQTIQLEFDYLINGETTIGFIVLRFKGVSLDIIKQHADSAYRSFQTAIECGFLNPGECVVLHDTPLTTPKLEILKYLTQLAKLINIEAAEAAFELGRSLHSTISYPSP